MSKLYYEGEEQFRPLSPWAYVGYSILFSIPLVGLILVIVFSLSDTGNVNRRNFARSFFCWFLIALILIVVLYILTVVSPSFRTEFHRFQYSYRL